MGQEITNTRFTEKDFTTYRQHLDEETELLIKWFQHNRFIDMNYVGGFELEAWLVDEQFLPAPCNQEFIQHASGLLVSPELAKFNVELNSNPQVLQGNALRAMHEELAATWLTCNKVASDLNARLLMIGILPTARESDLTLRNMSDMKRYRALNEQVLRLREGRPLELDILGNEHLKTLHSDVMLESATTSLQIHIQVPLERSGRFLNAAEIISGPMVGISANSPYLFGHELWEETRIPLFEQSVAVGGFAGAAQGPLRRVTFGSGYVRESLVEYFIENRDHYPVLLPMGFDAPAEQMNYLRLHNGTIWRWNRPLIGFENGQPHLRIEHRVAPGGPTVIDEIANMAFFFGLVQHLATCSVAPELRMPFSVARDNFYSAAKSGLHAHMTWLDGKKYTIQNLIREELLLMARNGLTMLNIDANDINAYLSIIEARNYNACTGAAWQKAFVAKHGHDMRKLTAAYLERQDSGKPVHEWDL
jgi:hypothetical protein